MPTDIGIKKPSARGGHRLQSERDGCSGATPLLEPQSWPPEVVADGRHSVPGVQSAAVRRDLTTSFDVAL